MTLSRIKSIAAVLLIATLSACASVSSTGVGTMVDVVYMTNPATGQVDGPFDPQSLRRIATEPGPDGQARVVIDPATGKPVLLDDVAGPALVAQPATAKAVVRKHQRTRMTVDPKTVSFAATPASPVGVLLSSYWDSKEAPAGWAIMVSAHPELAKKMPYLAEAKNKAGKKFYRLYATGFESAKDAQALCKLLTSRNEECLVVKL